ncbi:MULTISPECIES: HpcH/HpaI aldolase family protein [Dickeya]|uniref:Achromobactin biosynthesis protein AcsB, HpcH/HpaI aldolase family n=1 Tax=Dickeya aquatica TaxID=1401087 RepID=A0A375A8Y2_9GAMM|nr:MULTISPECIES: aldolase/citrate lyase family protein [Dickeya]SLM62485.1 Achromobactin biosynthesis protein AcsB, HpcH/HpaI aldolase family [Dickeya aquatica]
MLRANQLKRKLATGRPVYGLIASIPSPVSIELIAEAGFDFVIIDMEHVLINPETVENMIRVAESYGLTPLVRAADFNAKTLLRLLDGGAQGIVLPRVEQAAQVREAIRACFYHPKGERSLNSGRPGAFGKHSLAEYVVQANREIMLVAMIESAEGVRQASAIAAVDGLDMILEGAADLSQSLGMPWQTAADEVQAALGEIWQAAQAHHVVYCAIARQQDDHARARARGVQAFVLGDERGIAFRALQARLATTVLTEGK